MQRAPLEVPPAAPEWMAGAAAERRLAALRAADADRAGQMYLRPVPPPAPETIADAVGAWLMLRRWVNPATGAGYHRDAAALLRACGARPIAHLEPPRGGRLLRALVRLWARAGLAPKTRRNRLWIARQALLYRVELGLLAALPVFPRSTRPGEAMHRHGTHVLSEEEFARALDAIRAGVGGPARVSAIDGRRRLARRRLYVALLAYTGMHRADVERLLVPDDVTLHPVPAVRWRNTKSTRTGRRRVEGHGAMRPVPAPLAAELGRYAAACGGAAIPDGPLVGAWPAWWGAWAAACRRAGVHPASQHDLRRSYATWLARRGLRSEEIGRALGHAAGTGMTDRVYVQWAQVRGPEADAWPAEPAAGTRSAVTSIRR